METILVVTPEVAKSLRDRCHEPTSIVGRALTRALSKCSCSKTPQRQASEIERLVDKSGGVLLPLHGRVEGDLATYFVVEDISPGAAQALVSEFQHSPGVLSSYNKPAAVPASGLEPGPYVKFSDRRTDLSGEATLIMQEVPSRGG